MAQLLDQLHVVTQDGQQCFFWRAGQLSYIGQDRRQIPSILADRFGSRATRLDLSYNTLDSYKNIDRFTNLVELVLDNNSFCEHQLTFKQNLKLKTLSLNKNKLFDLYKFIRKIQMCFPNLEYLSLIGNPCCPILKASDGASDVDFPILQGQQVDQATQTYRYLIIYHLPNLRCLDFYPVTEGERVEALRRCSPR